MIKLFGQEVYEACESFRASTPPVSPVPVFADHHESLATCEALMILHAALPHINNVLTGNAGITTEGQIGDGQYTYLTPAQVQTRQIEMMGQINSIISLVQGGGVSGAFVRVVS
jgi:hypothetical protein